MDDSLILKDEVYRLVGAAMETYNELGHGYQEGVYQEAYERELVSRGIPFSAQKPLVIYYKGEPLQKSYVADLVAFDAVIVELKALERLTGREEAQLINYLKASKMQVGLLLNFGASRGLEWKRMILSQSP